MYLNSYPQLCIMLYFNLIIVTVTYCKKCIIGNKHYHYHSKCRVQPCQTAKSVFNQHIPHNIQSSGERCWYQQLPPWLHGILKTAAVYWPGCPWPYQQGHHQILRDSHRFIRRLLGEILPLDCKNASWTMQHHYHHWQTGHIEKQSPCHIGGPTYYPALPHYLHG